MAFASSSSTSPPTVAAAAATARSAPSVASSADAKQGAKQLDFIDCARGIAILLVIAVHANQPVEGMHSFSHLLASYGQCGVQLFFVASAFTLCLSYDRDNGASSRYDVFLLKRLFRIAPLYYVAVAMYFLIHWLSPAGADLHDTYSPGNMLANLTLIHGMIPQAANAVVPGGWSIGTEVAFYVCFPALFVAFAALHRRGTSWLLGAVAVTVVANAVLQWVLATRFGADVGNNSFWYYSLPNQLPVFLLGLCCYFTGRDAFVRRLSTAWWAAGFLVATAVALALWNLDLKIAFAIIPVIVGFSFVCLLALLARSGFDNAVLRAIGRASYSMYVFHFVVSWYVMGALLAWAPATLAREWIWLAGFVGVTAITYCIAVVSQRYIESRGIALGRRVIDALRGKRRKPAGSAGVLARPARYGAPTRSA